MAPSNANELTTPQPDGAFTTLKTPDVDDKRNSLVSQVQPSSSAPVQQLPWIGNVLQFLILAAIVVYAYGQLFYFTKAYSDLSATIGTWYGVPKNADKGSEVGHEEMIRPTYFFLLTMVPLAASLLLFQALRHFNVRRISSHYILGCARVLRRKPRVFGWVAPVSLGELLFLAFLIGGNIYVFRFYYLQRVEKNKKRGREFNFVLYLKMVGLTFGFTCIYNMAFLFLPATRNCVWMEFLNISYANGIKYHRWIGVVVVVTAFLHCFGYYWAWLKEGTWTEEALPCFDCAVGEEGHDPWMNFFGEIALLAFLAIGFTSIPWVRRKMYNTFYNVHHLFIIGTVFAVLHWNPVIAWLFPSVLLYTVCRAISSSNGFTPVSVREFTTLSHDVVKVVLSRSTTRAGDFKVGQFVYLNVPAISKLQWHAFTIGSSPRASPDTITILLKSLGDWTQELVKYSEDCKRTNVLPTVYMDGYYGTSLEMYDEYSTVCLVGGGIGVTPLFAILEDTVAKLQQGEALRQKVFFIFTFRELSLLEEIHPLLVQLKELDPQEQYFSLHFSLTRAPTNDQLDERIDHERLAGQTHVLATRYDTTTTRKNPQPFAEPLHSRSSKTALYTISFVVTLFAVILVKYGNKVQESDENLWPLQNFVEITLLIIVAMLSVYTCILLERKAPQPSTNYSRAFDVSETPRLVNPSLAADVQTFRDLVAEYKVEIGRRPNIPKLMKKVLAGHQQLRANHPGAFAPGNSTVGVFVSGPEAMKTDVTYAIADIGSHHFDMFEEEFEL
ncbi:ferric/cupric-chelate reductase [Phytophthora boehmeriae]|uniref:Ferric/cupric-chelate reductase n=1 Tax=Phytophthora boehmeriae TaxID=109152 RepID=A0A8T1VXC7_9STRA|nr:ferric/cupric-chelate reductase [Phytophthora boehmeriae]